MASARMFVLYNVEPIWISFGPEDPTVSMFLSHFKIHLSSPVTSTTGFSTLVPTGSILSFVILFFAYQITYW